MLASVNQRRRVMSHPAYPTPDDVRRYRAAANLAEREWQNNARIHAILTRALAELNKCDLCGYSLAHGYELGNIYDDIHDMLPALDDAAGQRLDAWAAAQTEAA